MTATTDIHPEYDAPTPQNIDEWSTDQLEAFNELQTQQFDDALEAETGLSEREQAVADELKTLADERAGEHEVELSEDVTLTVRAEVPGWALTRLQSLNENETWGELVDDILAVLCGVEGNPQKPGVIIGPEEYRLRAAWHSVAEQHGPAFLYELFEEVMAPVRERVEGVDGFRQK